MKIHFDQQADALYLRLDETPIVASEEVRPGVVLDFDADNQVVGMEIFNVAKRIPLAELQELKVEVF
jgi:uncharacterized protein YuzE